MSATLVSHGRYLPAGVLAAPVCVLVVGARGGPVVKALRGSPVAVRTVESGSAALNYVAYELPTDIVVIDAVRPDERVVTLIEAVRRHRYWCSIPILLFAAACDRGDLDRALEAGADECLPRPDRATLVSRVLQFARFGE